MWKSAKAKVNELFARESHHLRAQQIHKIRTAMMVQLYGAEKFTTSKRRQFQMRLNRAGQAATIWSDADWQRAIERLHREIHQVTPAKHKLFDKLFQYHERQPLQKLGLRQLVPEAFSPKNWLK